MCNPGAAEHGKTYCVIIEFLLTLVVTFDPTSEGQSALCLTRVLTLTSPVNSNAAVGAHEFQPKLPQVLQRELY